MTRISDAWVAHAKAGAKRSERLGDGAQGALLLRVTTTKSKVWYLRSQVGGDDKVQRLGTYPELSVADARAAAAKRAAEDGGGFAARGSFGALLDAYVADLRDRKRASAGDVERALLRAFPENHALRARPARDIGSADIVQVIADRRAAGRVEANRLRSYLYSAFQHGLKADFDPKHVAKGGLIFAIRGNPVTPIPVDREAEHEGDRVLTLDELRALWHALDSAGPLVASFWRLVLALGGPRVEQLLADTTDILTVEKQRALRIVDAKGRGKPREQVIPMLVLADRLWKAATEGATAPARFPLTKHQYRAGFDMARAVALPKATLRDPEWYTARDLRRTCETRMADLGVSREVLAYLASHARGVQARYERSYRLTEKIEALTKWHVVLEDIAARPPGAKRRTRRAK